MYINIYYVIYIYISKNKTSLIVVHTSPTLRHPKLLQNPWFYQVFIT